MSQPETELDDSTTDDAVMEQLQRKREAAVEGAEAEEEEDEPEVEAEEASAEEPEEPEADEDPEIDLGDLKAKKSQILAWKQGEMKDADYRRKTAEVAEAKRIAQAQQERVEQERSHYANQLDVLIGQLQAELVGDQQQLARLAQEDPGEWVRQNVIHQQRFQRLQQAAAERQALGQREQQAKQARQSDFIKEQVSTLKETIPEWRDDAAMQQELQDVDQFLKRNGFNDNDDLTPFMDSRAYLLIRKAWLADKQATARVAAKDKQVHKQPPKPLKAGSAQTPIKAGEDAYKAALRQAKSGKEDDLMALLAAKRRNA